MVVSVRFWLSRLGEERARRAATRWVLLVSLAGFGLTLLVFAATGRGTGQWFFLLVVWIGLVFLPLWLLTQAFQSIGPALRRGLTGTAAERADRYRYPSTVTLVVEQLFERNVLMPRIATPELAAKAREAAAAIVARVGRGAPGGVGAPLTECLAAVSAWTKDLSRWAASEAGEHIQARWAEVRALAALAALAKTLMAVGEDQRRLSPGAAMEDADAIHAFLDAVLDHCDRLALDVEAAPWIEPFPGLFDALPEPGDTLRGLWQRYVETPPPAPSALEAFVQATLHA
ncbi:MAG: hypothetical protein ACREN5_13465 [Gemmatimonadales bacterium]